MMPASIESMEVFTMGTCSDFKCKCGYEAFGKWGFGMNPIYQEQKISLAPALCKDCRGLVNINVNAVLPKCRECGGFNVIPYSDPSLGQVRRKSVKKTRSVYTGPAPDDNSKTGNAVQADMPDDDGLDFLDSIYDQFEVEDYIEGVDTTFYLCPKCNRFTLEKSGCGLFD